MASCCQQESFKLGQYIYEFEVNNDLKTYRSATFEIVNISYENLTLRRVCEEIPATSESIRQKYIAFARVGNATLDLDGAFQLRVYLEADDVDCANRLFLKKLQDELDSHIIKVKFWTSLIDVWKEKNECDVE